MKRYFFILLAAFAVLGTVKTKAIPAAAVPAPVLSISIASGCGLGVHRGPYDGCETVFDGNYAGADHVPARHGYVGFGRGRVCGGRGVHRVCNSIGLCRITWN